MPLRRFSFFAILWATGFIVSCGFKNVGIADILVQMRLGASASKMQVGTDAVGACHIRP